jgi:hypothetical protein
MDVAGLPKSVELPICRIGFDLPDILGKSRQGRVPSEKPKDFGIDLLRWRARRKTSILQYMRQKRVDFGGINAKRLFSA